MILPENRNALRFRNRPLLERLNQLAASTDRHVRIETARSGQPTLKLAVDGSFQYVHSKYDPQREAQRLIVRAHDLGQNDTVLFVGCGLGYTLRAFSAAHPDKRLILYEPDLQVLEAFLSYCPLDQWPSGVLTAIFTDERKLDNYLLTSIVRGQRLGLFVLPIYERLYGPKVTRLLKQLKEMMLDKRDNLAAEASFQKRWSINAVRNFPALLETPDMLQDVDRSLFAGKPAVIVAAGPSLNAEWNNLRRIKAGGLAWLFAVGSAVKGLINHGIAPDAVCSYDPQAHNYQVVKIVDEKGLTTIPLIFGSTVGYETVERFGGPKLHMIVATDSVSTKLLRRTDGAPITVLSDAASIAVIAFEMLSLLRADPIILAGQNLAYLHNQYYAQGIAYKGWNGATLSEAQQQNALKVKDVYGNDVLTKHNLNMMRQDLEFYIRAAKGSHVINTTKGGAAIAGAAFMPLEEVIGRFLKQKVVDPDWYRCSNHYDRKRVIARLKNVSRTAGDLEVFLARMVKALKRLDELCRQDASPEQIRSQIARFGKTMHKWLHNPYFNTFILPMMKVQTEHAAKVLEQVRFSGDVRLSGRQIVAEFNKLIAVCLDNKQALEPDVKQLEETTYSLKE
ncbi:MAG: DUF115 domain-containing protein [Sporolactobacillus sp.]|jgi:hypothetical protein|nr:DUF115 domain-containing protein [Sporolactobacillus sp.]